MNLFKQWTAAALSLALAGSLMSAALAVPAAEPFADFRIDAVQMDAPDRTLSIDLYRRDEQGGFLAAEAVKDDDRTLSCKVNRVTSDASFYIQPKAEGVWAALDFLTDVNGDGLYELLDGGDDPAWDSLNAQGELVQGGNEALLNGQTYILSAEALSARFDEAAQARAQDWAMEDCRLSFPLCRVTLSRTDPADGQTYEQLYYLEIFGDLLLPYDVPRDSQYRDAIEYCLVQGWFTGMEDGSFHPDAPLNRAQLAQVLWTVGGCQAAPAADFTDVSQEDWFSQAVSWCRQEGLIAGYDDGSFLPDTPLTREQLASFLFRYAKYAGSSPYPTGDLSRYDDHASVSPWAYDSVRWAVSGRLLTPDGSSLNPGTAVTRAELASALYAYHTYRGAQSLRTMW